MSWGPRKRFWTTAAVTPEAEGFSVRLDDRPLLTPAKARLVVPTAGLAAAVAAEWNAVEGKIRPEALDFTRAANSAIDRVLPARAGVADGLAAYGDADLICYRAEEPEALREREAEAWDPWIVWAARDLGADLEPITGVMHCPQPEAALRALRSALEGADAFALTGIHDLVTFSGSLVLGLAVARGALPADTAWDLSRVDERWQAELWGADDEAEAADLSKRAAFLRAATWMSLLQASSDQSDGA